MKQRACNFKRDPSSSNMLQRGGHTCGKRYTQRTRCVRLAGPWAVFYLITNERPWIDSLVFRKGTLLGKCPRPMIRYAEKG